MGFLVFLWIHGSKVQAGASSSMDSKPRALPLTNFNSVPSGHGSCPLFLGRKNRTQPTHAGDPCLHGKKITDPSVYAMKIGFTLDVILTKLLELQIRQEKLRKFFRNWVFNSSARKMSKDAAERGADSATLIALQTGTVFWINTCF